MSVQDNAKRCTDELIDALEGLIEGDGNRAVIYGNSAIAAALMLFNRYGVDQTTLKILFEEIWMPMTIPALEV